LCKLVSAIPLSLETQLLAATVLGLAMPRLHRRHPKHALKVANRKPVSHAWRAKGGRDAGWSQADVPP